MLSGKLLCLNTTIKSFNQPLLILFTEKSLTLSVFIIQIPVVLLQHVYTHSDIAFNNYLSQQTVIDSLFQ